MPQNELMLYHAWGSSASRKVRLCLAEKGLSYAERSLTLARFEHHEDWYKKLNPSGIVPALVVNGRSLVESNFINEWLDETYPDPPLRPHDPFQRHEMRLWAKYIDDQCLPAIQKHNWMGNFHPMAKQWSDEELERRLAVIPTEERRKIWRRMARDPFTSEELEAALNVLRDMLDRIETRLTKTPHIVGENYSLADIAAAPYVVRLQELRPDELSVAKRPNTARWWQELQARPAYPAAHLAPYSEHAKEGWQPPSSA